MKVRNKIINSAAKSSSSSTHKLNELKYSSTIKFKYGDAMEITEIRPVGEDNVCYTGYLLYLSAIF